MVQICNASEWKELFFLAQRLRLSRKKGVAGEFCETKTSSFQIRLENPTKQTFFFCSHEQAAAEKRSGRSGAPKPLVAVRRDRGRTQRGVRDCFELSDC